MQRGRLEFADKLAVTEQIIIKKKFYHNWEFINWLSLTFPFKRPNDDKKRFTGGPLEV